MDTIATTSQGQLEGREREGVLLFAGIPYAAPPIGERRFRPPDPHEPWEGVRAAHRFGPVSWQTAGLMGGLLGGPEPVCDEDCLTLNVQTPALDDAARPVMVWIHGGGFTGGTGATPWYNGTSFAQRGDVVVVTINYRLGALGFLHLADLEGGDAYDTAGCNGILDQVAALEWVRDNIAAFGGDPGNVTIFGESAGGMSVATLLGMPRARGLFHRAIPQSGAAHAVSPPERAAEVTQLFLKEAGISDLDGLLAAPPKHLLDAQAALPAILLRERAVAAMHGGSGAALALGMPFRPVVHGDALPEAPLDAVRNGLNADVPLLTGTTLEEWKLFHLMNPGPLDDTRLLRRLDRTFPNGAEIAEVYRAGRPGASADEVWCAVLTDAIFRIPAIRLAEAQSAHQPDNTFMYRFSWRTPAFKGKLGACHALEIPFVFNNLSRAGTAVFAGDGPYPDAMTMAMHDAWWHFARTGDPHHENLDNWNAYDETRRATMDFATDFGPIDDPDSEERAVWAGQL